MADPTQAHGRGAQKLPSPPNVRSPLSPGSGSGTPISFQTNVNRSKTKRWVEAKQYSYDGGDWGSDDEEEEEEEAPPAVPRPPYATHNTGSSSELSSRRFGAGESRQADGKTRNIHGGDQTALPFVRPADLYKRMREEQTTQQSPVTGSNDPKPDSFGALPQTNQQDPELGLPEVKRMSSFGADFLGGADSNLSQDSSASQDPSLNHKSSSGFRSVVNQAFDVPETPQSTASFARSNSDGTSTISPIMGSRTMTDERTPTIIEEPNESGSPKATATAAPALIPGHRRDLSLPSPDNSPLRTPQVTDLDTPTAGHAELSSIPPLQSLSPESSDAAIPPQNPSMQPYSHEGQDMPAPLKFGSASGPDTLHSEIPTIMGTEESPQNTDNDRLREEIIRSLSREATPSEDPEPSKQPESQAPAEPVVSESHADRTTLSPLPSRDPYANSQVATGNSSSTIADEPKKPKLERRFSWESSDSEEPEPPRMPGSYSSPPPPLATSLSTQDPEPIHEAPAPVVPDVPHDSFTSDDEGSDTQRAVAKPRLSIVPPIPENTTPPEQVMGPGVTPPTPPPQPQVSSNAGTSSLDESQLLGFRDILGITSINQRIKSFEHTRDQFATIDTGLNHWLQFTIQEHPEHASVVKQSQSFSPIVPSSDASRSRFPKLGALGSLGSLNDGTPTSATHVRRPSGHLGTVMNKEKVGEKGKELLHTAGAFSGKATGAAKGLFAKGRSRFRPSGGSEKVQSTANASRRSLQFSFPPGSDVSGNSSLRKSVTLRSLPFKSEQTGPNSDPDPQVSLCLDCPRDEHNAGKCVEATNSGNNSLSHNHISTTVQQKQLPSSSGAPLESGVPGKSAFAGDLEQEMITALGLSPTGPHPQRSASTPMVLSALSQVPSRKRQFTEPLPQKESTSNQLDTEAPVDKAPVAENKLPVIPDEPFDVPFPVINSQKHQPSKSIPEIVIPSIRPVCDESPRPPSRTPPPPPPKDNDNGLVPRPDHTRQTSVSTLGADERAGGTSDDELDRHPPSPLQETANEVTPEPWYKNKAEDPVDEPSDGSRSSPPEKRKSFIPFYPLESPSSAEILESKRKSISGLPPPSTPDVHSPLRNEVRYSPGTRSIMLSFGSFGKQSANGKGTRPSTPANDLSRPSESGSLAENGESTIGKLKNFGRRRRASVGDLLSGIQLQQPQGAPEGQRKRALSRISGLFGRQSSQDPERKQADYTRPTSEQLQFKYPPTPPSTNGNSHTSFATQDEPPALGNPFEPTQPPKPTAPLPPSYAKPLPRDHRQRASLSLPPSSSSNSLTTGRFYSQIQSGSMNGAPTPSRHASTLSQPLTGYSRSPSPMSLHENRAPPALSRETHQTQNQDLQLGTLSENHEQEKHEEHKDRMFDEHLQHESYETNNTNHPGQQDELQGDRKQQSLAPPLSIRSRNPVVSDSPSPTSENHITRNNTVSNAPVISAHPHRSEDRARVVNDTPQPVELAATADDSSEEIVMSPTSYPGQEWTPMHL
ncbi:hypothetical protein N7472_001017 [Penicillium cf. griseofulvum]|uniref:Uncharacterized protein n=1 Tax=Penicillium cf. griseofulvum TaxID=2972120 RepID=A0A9W9N154_9EURO|nr:hypothetical protein N7472_001017 [Penicillium cf. griseofulvum]